MWVVQVVHIRDLSSSSLLPKIQYSEENIRAGCIYIMYHIYTWYIIYVYIYIYIYIYI